jgi:RES domain-containing protein
VRSYDTHRLIPEKFVAHGDSVLRRIASSDEHLQEIFDLDHATNDRLIAENNRLLGIGVQELVFGVPNFRIVNAAFCHAQPLGSRFNGPDRGAWYAAFDLATSEAEVAFHKSLEFLEIDWPEEKVPYREILADFSGQFHDLRAAPEFVDCLNPESYRTSQALAERLLTLGSAGVVYPSVRHLGGTCLACFRPAMVGHVRLGQRRVFHYRREPSERSWTNE